VPRGIALEDTRDGARERRRVIDLVPTGRAWPISVLTQLVGAAWIGYA